MSPLPQQRAIIHVNGFTPPVCCLSKKVIALSTTTKPFYQSDPFLSSVRIEPSKIQPGVMVTYEQFFQANKGNLRHELRGKGRVTPTGGPPPLF